MSRNPSRTHSSQSSAGGSRPPSQPRSHQSPATGGSSPWQPHGSRSPVVGYSPGEGAPGPSSSRPSPVKPAGPPSPFSHANSPLNIIGMGLGPLPSRDRTLHHFVHQTGPGTFGAGPPLPPQHDITIHSRSPQTAEPQLPSVHDARNGTYPGLPPMAQLVGMNIGDAREIFTRARAAALPYAPPREHEEDFQRQWDDQIRRRDAAAAAAAAAAPGEEFARRVLAGTVPNLPPMGTLVSGMSIETARDLYVRARAAALPRAPPHEHQAAFQMQWDDQGRRRAAFAQKVRDGAIPGLPHMRQLIRQRTGRDMFVRARSAALPGVPPHQHLAAFEELSDEQVRQENAAAALRGEPSNPAPPVRRGPYRPRGSGSGRGRGGQNA
ncbi:MAG: hypothetical protein Q9210_000527 [Variospora velana]